MGAARSRAAFPLARSVWPRGKTKGAFTVLSVGRHLDGTTTQSWHAEKCDTLKKLLKNHIFVCQEHRFEIFWLFSSLTGPVGQEDCSNWSGDQILEKPQAQWHSQQRQLLGWIIIFSSRVYIVLLKQQNLHHRASPLILDSLMVLHCLTDRYMQL